MTHLHPTDESLVAYLENDVHDDDERDLERHLHDCDRCVGDLTRIQPLLASGRDLALRVPPAIRARLAEDSRSRPSNRRPSPAARRSRLLRWPVLIPSSLAAGFLIGLSVAALRQPNPQVTTRAVEPTEKSFSVVAETSVRDAPSDGGGEVASLRSGEEVIVVERRGPWARIEARDGRGGWVPYDHLR